MSPRCMDDYGHTTKLQKKEISYLAVDPYGKCGNVIQGTVIYSD